MAPKYQRIRYKNDYYAVIDVKYKDLHLPIVIDWDDFAKIRNVNKAWKCNKLGFISCSHTYDGATKEVFIHDVVMAIKQKDLKEDQLNKPIIHLNRIGLDNRRENLLYDIPDKELNKNIKKKKRTIILPDDTGIDPAEIPTYVWYMKPNGTHGDRFMVEIGDLVWKTTSSRKLSLRYKLEEAKLFLRQLKKERPELFEDYSMNGDYTKEGKELMDSYYSIVHRAGYENIAKFIPKNMTDELLKPATWSRKEKGILRQQGNLVNNQEGGKKRRILTKLPPGSGVNIGDLPKHCYYHPASEKRGDYFIVENHPKQETKLWRTTTSTNVTTAEKYAEMLQYIDFLE